MEAQNSPKLEYSSRHSICWRWWLAWHYYKARDCVLQGGLGCLLTGNIIYNSLGAWTLGVPQDQEEAFFTGVRTWANFHWEVGSESLTRTQNIQFHSSGTRSSQFFFNGDIFPVSQQLLLSEETSTRTLSPHTLNKAYTWRERVMR